MAIYDITVDNVIDFAADFIEQLSLGACQQAQVDRVPMPNGQFCILTPMRFIRLSTTSQKNVVQQSANPLFGFSDGYTPMNVAPFSNGNKNAIAYGEIRQADIQVDIYGDEAGSRAMALETVFRSQYAYDTLKAIDTRIAPLYSSDVIQAPMINAEDQWQERYIITLSFQVHVTITLQQDYFDQAEISIRQVK